MKSAIPEKTVVCLKWGSSVYSVDWINRLYRGVYRHLSPPFRFVAFTDEIKGLEPGIESRNIEQLTFAPSLSGIWWKLAIMHPNANLNGTCLFLDLDTVITGNLDDFFTFPGRFCIIRNWIERRKQIFRHRPFIGNSSVFRFVADQEEHVVTSFIKNPTRANNRKLFRTEQAFMTAAVGLNNITWWPEKWVRSYKRHCLPPFPLNRFLPPTIPQDTRVLAFHGNPKPSEVICGVPDKWHKYSLPMTELEAHWD